MRNIYATLLILVLILASQLSFASPIPPQFFVNNFEVFSVEGEMILEWTISKDVSVDYFVIEKSNDNNETFNEIGKIQVRDCSEEALFIFSDENVEEDNNYRIRVHLKNGKNQTSQVLKGLANESNDTIPVDISLDK